MTSKLLCTLLLGLPILAAAAGPDCKRWPTNMAFVQLKNAGLTDNARVDFAATETTVVASEAIGKGLYRQVHRVRFHERSGATIEVITVSDASADECSMGAVQVYLVARQLGAAASATAGGRTP